MKVTFKESALIIEPEDKFYISSERPFTPIEIKEINEHHDDEFGKVRLYSNYIGDSTKNENSFVLQIRAFQPLKDGLKKRNMIASVILKDSEIMDLARFVIQNREKHKTFVERNI